MKDLGEMICLATSLRPAVLVAALMAVRDRAALTLGPVTVDAVLYAVASQVPPFSGAAEKLVDATQPGALVATCAVAPAAGTAELLTRFLDVLDAITGGVLADPLRSAAEAILATAIAASAAGAQRDAGTLAGSRM